MPQLESSARVGRRVRACLAAEGGWLVRIRPATATLTAPLACTFSATCWAAGGGGGAGGGGVALSTQTWPRVPGQPTHPAVSSISLPVCFPSVALPNPAPQ